MSLEKAEIESIIKDYLRDNINIELSVENDFEDSYLNVKVSLDNVEIASDYVNVRNIVKSV